MVALMCMPSCAEIAMVQSAMTASALQRMQERLSVNAWSDALEVKRRTTVITAGQNDDTLGVVAPAWSNGGLAVRVAAPARTERLYMHELQVAAYSQSGIRPRVRVGSLDVRSAGVFQPDWHRFPLSAELFQQAKSNGLTIHVECDLGEWVFSVGPGYFLGYEEKVSSLRMSTYDRHAPDS